MCYFVETDNKNQIIPYFLLKLYSREILNVNCELYSRESNPINSSTVIH